MTSNAAPIKSDDRSATFVSLPLYLDLYVSLSYTGQIRTQDYPTTHHAVSLVQISNFASY